MRFWEGKRPQIWAHRGASMHAPENTLSAFRLALEMGADCLELDITPSADGVPMVIHDPNLERTTNGAGDVRQLSAAEIQKYDAGVKHGANTRASVSPPSKRSSKRSATARATTST
jgi:Glycerophosphoryl diester phosphodiesterase